MPAKQFDDSLILNVDDNEGARYAKSRILKRAGFKVIEAASGNEAIVMAMAEQPALVLLDVKLPDMNGMEVCRRLKADGATAPILVLQTSAAYIGVADKIRALEGGADNYLFEPIEPEELVASVRALLRLGSVERQLRDVERRKDECLATLPLAAPATAAAAPEPVDAAARAATRVLVVDDNVDAADMLAELLGFDGHEVVTAYSGTQALERAQEFRPRFVFLDIGLPDMSGYQVAARMRQIEHMNDAVLIALTGYGQERDREMARDAGFDEHVVKPIDFAKIGSLNLHTRTAR